MAVTIVGTYAQGTDSDNTSTATVSHTLVAGSNRWVLAIVNGEDGSFVPSSATYGGNAMSTLVSQSDATSGTTQDSWIFGIKETNLPANGANDCVITFSGGYNRVRITVVAFQDADQTDVAAAQKAQAATTNQTTAADTLTSVTGGMIVAGTVKGTTDSSITLGFSGGTLGTEVAMDESFNLVSQAYIASSYIPVTTGGTTTVTATVGTANDELVMTAICLSPAAAAGPVGVVVTALSDIQ